MYNYLRIDKYDYQLNAWLADKLSVTTLFWD